MSGPDFNGTNGTNQTLPPFNSPIWGTFPEFSGRKLQVDIIVCAAVTWLIALGFVVTRFYTRGRIIHVLGPTDWCIIPSLVFAGGVTASTIEQAARGSGVHFWQLDITQAPLITRASWYGILFYSLSLTFTKISILLLYRRIFTYSWAKRASQIVLVIVLITGAWLTSTVFTACVPLEAFWNWEVAIKGNVYCHPLSLWWSNNGLHVATDIIIVLLPMPVLLRLRLPRREKYALVGLFTMGFFVCIVSIVRLITLIEVETEPLIDPTYKSANLSYWTSVEVNAATSGACIMTLKPLMVRMFPRLLMPSTSSFRSCDMPHLPDGEPDSTSSRRSLGSRASPDLLERGGAQMMMERRSTRTTTKSGLLPWMEEGDAGLLEDDDDDLLETGESNSGAHRSHSVSTAAGREEEAVTPLGGHSGQDHGHGHDQGSEQEKGALSAPPKAHLRLAIQVTKTVHVTTSRRDSHCKEAEES